MVEIVQLLTLLHLAQVCRAQHKPLDGQQMGIALENGRSMLVIRGVDVIFIKAGR